MPKPMAPCGTTTAYDRHRRNGEPPCDPCRIANARYQREKRRSVPDFAMPLPPKPQPLLELKPVHWMDRAACRDVNPEWFFSEDPEETEAALRVCSRCDLHVECLRYAIETNSDGIWGGYKPSEIDRLRKVRA